MVTELASVLDSLGVGREGDELFRLARLVLDGFQRRTELEDLELGVLGVMWAARSAVTDRHQLVAGGAGPGGAGLRRALQRTVRADARDDAGRRLARGGAPARRRRGRAGWRRLAGAATRVGVRPRDGGALLRRPRRGLARRGGVDHRHRRAALPRRLQQRSLRRPWPSAGDRRHLPPGAADQHPHALSAPRRDRVGRATDRPVPTRARHGAAGQLRVRGQRPGVAHGDRGHRPARRPLHRLRLPRDHRGHGGAVAGVLVRHRAARARRAMGAARPLPRRAPRRRRLRGRGGRGCARGGSRRRRRSSTGW